MISIIAAIGPKRELGKDNRLLWHIPGDLPRFKKLTQGHAVIMGRKTFESLGKPLPDRLNVIITHRRDFLSHENLTAPSAVPSKAKKITFDSLSDAFNYLKSENEIFVIGGGQIYAQALPLADKLYLTLVGKTPKHPDGKFDADTFFPEYETLFTKKVFEEKYDKEGYKYSFIELTR